MCIWKKNKPDEFHVHNTENYSYSDRRSVWAEPDCCSSVVAESLQPGPAQRPLRWDGSSRVLR